MFLDFFKKVCFFLILFYITLIKYMFRFLYDFTCDLFDLCNDLTCLILTTVSWVLLDNERLKLETCL